MMINTKKIMCIINTEQEGFSVDAQKEEQEKGRREKK